MLVVSPPTVASSKHLHVSLKRIFSTAADCHRMIEVAGDIMEGGGQILRNATALSCILNKPIRISDIRAKRAKPGLRPQHLCGIKLLGEMCKASLSGDEVNSCAVEVSPSDTIHGGEYTKEVGTAGSLTLLLQSTLPVALFSTHTCNIRLGGGTNAEAAPPVEYFDEVFRPIASRMGIHVDFQLLKRGFYPKGGGQVKVQVNPVKSLKPITMVDRGDVVKISGVSYVAGQLQIKVAQQMAREAGNILQKQFSRKIPIDIESRYEPESRAVATGTGIFLTAHTSEHCVFGGTGIGRKGIPAKEVGREAAEQLLKAITDLGCVDEHLQDQLIIFMALASGKSTVRTGPLTLHTETAMHIANQLTGVEFSTENQEDGTIILSCEGIGYENPNM